MEIVPFSRQETPVLTRRAVTAWVARLAGGAALVALLSLPGAGFVQPVAAQDDDTIVLSAGGAELSVTPGGDVVARSAVAVAEAAPGFARTQGAAAEAVADCIDGAMTRGAAALAVAHPDEGALTESALVEIAASNQKDDKPIRKVVERKCPEREKEKPKPKEEKKAPPVEKAPPPVVVEVPDTGIGSVSQLPVSSLFAAASAVAALGAVGLRDRRRFAALLLADRR
jgi:hypothetical protein